MWCTHKYKKVGIFYVKQKYIICTKETKWGGVFLLLSKISFYGTTLILVILILVLSLKFNKKVENKVNDKVSNEDNARYFDGEYQTEIPGKDMAML